MLSKCHGHECTDLVLAETKEMYFAGGYIFVRHVHGFSYQVLKYDKSVFLIGESDVIRYSDEYALAHTAHSIIVRRGFGG